MPGDVTLLVAGLISSQGNLNLGLLIAIASVGAICGDSIGYLIGRYGGLTFIRRYGRYFFFKESHLEKTQHYFDVHGGKTILFGRFVAVIKSVGPVAAGIGRMRYATFLAYNVVGSILSVTLYLVIGYFFGASWKAISTWAGRGAAIAFGFVVIAGAIAIVARRRRKQRLRNGARRSGS
ncbi:MAG: DedA family protein [Thermoleophilia bacterium]|nr:DedA family protein [Thermoleophilia bacterium]